MNRRDVLLVGAGLTLAKITASATACAGSHGRAGPNKSPAEAAARKPVAGAAADAAHRGDRQAALARALSSCERTGRDCSAHCLRLLAERDVSMAECAQRVGEMLAVCEAMARLAAMRSELARTLAPACKVACTTCAAVCKPHVAHHADCKACYEACQDTLAALDHWLAA